MSFYFKGSAKKTEDKEVKSTLVKNFISLALLQGSNFILPLLVIPHLFNVLGPEKFGLVSVAQVIALYLVIFSEYGFNLSATKEVSLARNDKTKLAEIYNTVISTRMVLCLIGFLILCLLVFIVPSLKAHYPLHIFSSAMMFGQALVPVWFFLGIEKMKFITYLNIISKLVFTLLTFIIIQEADHYIYANLLHGLGSLLAGLVSMYVVARNFGIKFRFASISNIKTQLASGFHIFVSNFSTNIYMNINIVILGFLASPEIVGYYSIAEKVFIAAKHLISAIFQSVYSYSCKLYTQSIEGFKVFFTRFAYLASFLMLVFGAGTYIFSDLIIYFLAKNQLIPYASMILKMMSFIPLVIIFGVPAYQTALIDDKKRLSTIMMLASLINVVLNIVLGQRYAAEGTVITIFLTEAFVTIALTATIWHHKKLWFFNIKNLQSFKQHQIKDLAIEERLKQKPVSGIN